MDINSTNVSTAEKYEILKDAHAKGLLSLNDFKRLLGIIEDELFELPVGVEFYETEEDFKGDY